MGLNINLYITDDIELDYPNAVYVNDVDEAIGIINSKYGGIDSYLKNILEVDVDKLREIYLE